MAACRDKFQDATKYDVRSYQRNTLQVVTDFAQERRLATETS